MRNESAWPYLLHLSFPTVRTKAFHQQSGKEQHEDRQRQYGQIKKTKMLIMIFYFFWKNYYFWNVLSNAANMFYFLHFFVRVLLNTFLAVRIETMRFPARKEITIKKKMNRNFAIRPGHSVTLPQQRSKIFVTVQFFLQYAISEGFRSTDFMHK